MAELGTKLFVGCLPYSKTEVDIHQVFGQVGPISEVVVLRKADGSSKGAAFVVFEQVDHATSAVSMLQNYTFPGSTRGITVSMASSTGTGQKGSASFGNGATNLAAQAAKAAAAAAAAAAQGRLGMGQPPPPVGPYTGMSPQSFGMAAAPAARTPRGGAGFMGQHSMMGLQNGGAAGQVPGTKLFVGQLPYSKSETDLWSLFGSVGPVVEVSMLKDKTGQKRGAAFVKYQTPQQAALAVASLDGFLFAGSTRPISVAIAQSELAAAVGAHGIPASGKRPRGLEMPLMLDATGTFVHVGQPVHTKDNATEEGAKLFVGQLPYSRSEADLQQLFGNYGAVAEVILLRDQAGQKKGAAFVKFFAAEHAQAALELDGYLFQGSPRPITVAIAGEGSAKKRRVA